MPFVPSPYMLSKHAYAGAGHELADVTKTAVKVAIKAPRNFWHYMRDGLGDEHAAEEERKRQVILQHMKKKSNQ